MKFNTAVQLYDAVRCCFRFVLNKEILLGDKVEKHRKLKGGVAKKNKKKKMYIYEVY